jgi:hypothetical protein
MKSDLSARVQGALEEIIRGSGKESGRTLAGILVAVGKVRY